MKEMVAMLKSECKGHYITVPLLLSFRFEDEEVDGEPLYLELMGLLFLRKPSMIFLDNWPIPETYIKDTHTTRARCWLLLSGKYVYFIADVLQ